MITARICYFGIHLLQFLYTTTGCHTKLNDDETNRTLWARITKTTDSSTRPLARPFARSLAPLICLLALHYSLCSRALLHLLAFCSLRSLSSSWDSDGLDGYSFCFFSILARSAVEYWAICSSFRSFAHSFACSTLLALLALCCLFLCLSVCLTKKLSDVKEIALIIREITILVQYSAHPSLSHYGPEQKKTQTKKPSNHLISHKWGSEWMSEWVSTAERVSEASRAKQANECKQANAQMDKQAAQHYSLNFWLFWTIMCPFLYLHLSIHVSVHQSWK